MTDAVAERRLELAAVEALLVRHRLPGRDVHEVHAASLQSTAEMRTDMGFTAGHAPRTAWKTLSGKRTRFSSGLPCSSSRRLVRGEMKLALSVHGRLGGIRDAFSDLLLPGTSTIQTRLRYFLLVPWI